MRTDLASAKTQNRVARFTMAAAFAVIGSLHFIRPEGFDAIVPDAIPNKRFWVYATGVAELAGAAALATRPNRRVGWFLAGLLLLVFPANINQALQGIQIPGAPELPRWALFARLPLQAVMIWAVLAGTRPAAASGAPATPSANP